MTVKNTLNYNHEDWKGKEFTLPSQTVPDMSMSIRTIMDKFATGQPIGGTFEEIWEEEETNGINPRTLDLVDLQGMKMQNQKKINQLKDKLSKDLKEVKDNNPNLDTNIP